MVKRLDENSDALLLRAHVGLDLWRAALAWRERFHSAMVERGHAWYGDARAVIAQHLEPAGMSQTELVARVGSSKQAVQQLLDALEADGVVRREPDANDGRAKRVTYTKKGLAALRDGVRIKRAIEAEYRERLGGERYDALVDALRALVPEDGADEPGQGD